jgi:hypothetical protein
MRCFWSNGVAQRGHYVIAALLAWGLITFLGVYLGVQAGSRRLRRAGEGSRSSRAPVALPAADA